MYNYVSKILRAFSYDGEKYIYISLLGHQYFGKLSGKVSEKETSISATLLFHQCDESSAVCIWYLRNYGEGLGRTSKMS